MEEITTFEKDWEDEDDMPGPSTPKRPPKRTPAYIVPCEHRPVSNKLQYQVCELSGSAQQLTPPTFC
eukprot:8844403-Pyramimonas_sp.AAC.1